MIGEIMKAIFEAEDYILHGAGREDVDARVQTEDEPSGQSAEPQSDKLTDGDQSKILKINGVEWKQWIRNLLFPFK